MSLYLLHLSTVYDSRCMYSVVLISISDVYYYVHCIHVHVHTGSWKKVESIDQIRESAIFETYSGGYVIAEDSGYFTVGDVRQEGVW